MHRSVGSNSFQHCLGTQVEPRREMPVPRMRLTDAAIEKTKPTPGARMELWDSLLPGFGVGIGSGRRAFFVSYRVTDPATGKAVRRRPQVGTYPATKLTDARKSARETQGKVQWGEDPGGEKPGQLGKED